MNSTTAVRLAGEKPNPLRLMGFRIATALVVTATGCTGVVGEAGQGAASQEPGVAGVPGAPGAPLPARVRRFTPGEYQATVTAAVGTSSWPAITFPNDSRSDGYLNRADELRVTSALTQALWDGVPAVAGQVAAKLVASASCKPNGTNDDMCAMGILSSFASSAYRRAPDADDMTDLMTVFHLGRDGADFTSGIETALEVVLQSAGIMYRTELGDDAAAGATATLTSREIADELSYLATGNPPDQALLAAADAGELASADAREQHLTRLFSTPAARSPLGEFAAQWLEIIDVGTSTRDPVAFPGWMDMKDREIAGTQAFFAQAVLGDGADLAALFTAAWTAGDATLAAFYGGAPGDRVIPAHPHSGILTEASVLAAHAQNIDSSPIQRGHLVRVRLLCQTIPPPPPTLIITPPKPDATRTTRARFSDHDTNPTCQGCHKMMDPIGDGLENFDAIGAYRSTDNGKPVDASGSLTDTDVDGDFNGPVELGNRLAQSEEARECFARQWLSYATARAVDDASWGALESIASGFVTGQASIVALMTGLVRSPAFIVRVRPSP